MTSIAVSMNRAQAQRLRRPVIAVALALATVPAITAGLAVEALVSSSGRGPRPVAAGAYAVPLVALPLAVLLLLIAAASIAGLGAVSCATSRRKPTERAAASRPSSPRRTTQSSCWTL